MVREQLRRPAAQHASARCGARAPRRPRPDGGRATPGRAPPRSCRCRCCPGSAMPSPCTSTRPACSVVSGASRSSSHAVAARMKSPGPQSRWRSTGTPAASAGSRQDARGAGVPFVTTKHATPAPATAATRARAAVAAERGEVADLAVAEHLDAVGMQLRQEARRARVPAAGAAASRSGGRGRARPPTSARPSARRARLEQLAGP